ncbi:PIN domain-containing protein [Phenylobacterium aquaticum]|uniref:PIN domain-containing protein n=1 Tax=Phenylobacterium aquaticum TaxID=1763816 RepID=UPI001F5D1256|nr:PIN domain-containing protein [Phenylobacterium aquaticum]
MFANRFTAIVDACSLANALRRNLLLTLAEAEFFRLRWSAPILAETELAIEKILAKKGVLDAPERAKKARASMESAFEEACVADFGALLSICVDLPDPKDAHVVAAALKTQAALIVTENLKDFPQNLLSPLNIEAKSADAFIADTLALDIGRGVAAVRRMRERFKRPEITAESLLLDMEAQGLTATVDILRPHVQSL